MNIFITGIDTHSGKTIISAGMAAVMQSLGYKTGVFKPIQTGAIDKITYLVSPDLTFVKMLDPYITTHATYMLKVQGTPTVCAEIENIDINIDNIVNDYSILNSKTDTLIVESTGGLMTPLKDRLFSYHIPLKLKLPIVFVITPSSNSISSYLNEINTAKTAGLDIAGVIINKYPIRSTNTEIKSFPKLIEKYSDTKILGLIRKFEGNSVQANTLITEILNGINLEEVFRIKIAKLNSY